MMKTFDEIYQELKTEDMQEINKLYECVKKKSKNQKRIALIICAIVDILILFLSQYFLVCLQLCLFL